MTKKEGAVINHLLIDFALFNGRKLSFDKTEAISIY